MRGTSLDGTEYATQAASANTFDRLTWMIFRDGRQPVIPWSVE